MTGRTIFSLVALAIANACFSLWMGQQAYQWMPVQASAEAMLVDDLFSFLVTIATFILMGVLGALLFVALFQRADKYDLSDGPPIEGNVKLEVVWTAIPLVLVIWTAGYSFRIYDQMGLLGPGDHIHLGGHLAMGSAVAATLDTQTPAANSDDPRTLAKEAPPTAPIEVHSRQWAWEFYYPDQGITSTELHLPVNQRAQLVLTSEDVLHGFYVPAFRIKQDIIPGRAIDFEFTPIREGRYRLRDSDYSGTYFAANQSAVVVETEDAYQAWLATAAQQTPAAAANPAFAEYTRASENPISLGWPTVQPAPAPLVNFASSEEDPYE